MSHGGNPEAGTNPWIGTDGTGLAIASPSGPDTWVVPVNDNFTVAMTWELTGNLAIWLSKFKFDYTVTYTFAGLGNAQTSPVVAVNHGPNTAAQQKKHYVILVSMDGLRYDYAERYNASTFACASRKLTSTHAAFLPAKVSVESVKAQPSAA